MDAFIESVFSPLVVAAVVGIIGTITVAKIQRGREGKDKNNIVFSAYERRLQLSNEENDGLREENDRLREVAKDREELIEKLRIQVEKLQSIIDEKNNIINELHNHNDSLRAESNRIKDTITDPAKE